MFVMSDLEDVLRTRTNLPLIEIYYQATGSKSVSTALLAVFAFSLFGCACGNVTSSSRQIWSVALDDCLPLSVFWKRIHAQWQMPANAAFLTGIVVSVSLPLIGHTWRGHLTLIFLYRYMDCCLCIHRQRFRPWLQQT